MKRRKFDPASVTLPPLANSPLDLFPTKGDIIRTNFVRRIKNRQSQSSKSVNNLNDPSNDNSDTNHQNNNSSSQQWLHADKIDDKNFGVDGQGEVSQVTRAYRRLASSTVFNPSTLKDTSLRLLEDGKGGGGEGKKGGSKAYVLVEESKLHELLTLDAALQREKSLLGEQCITVLSDTQLSARIPIPATRYAIHQLCLQQMNTVHQELIKLSSAWSEYSQKHGYGRRYVYANPSSYLFPQQQCIPPLHRVMKVKLIHDANTDFNCRRERDTMTYEDDSSFYTNLYYDAMIRDRDYERYYILSSRYGAMSEEEFTKDDRPGKRYYQSVLQGAQRLQRLWSRYWIIRSHSLHRNACKIQKYYRRYTIYRKLHPIIKLRLKVGKKSYYRLCLWRWKEYNQFVKWIRECVKFYLANECERCFAGWKEYRLMMQRLRREREEKIAIRSRYGIAYAMLYKWKFFIANKKKARLKLAKLLVFPYVDIWIDYTKYRKHVRKLHAKAKFLQAMIRRFLVRNHLHVQKEAKKKLLVFTTLIFARHRVQGYRQAFLDKHYLLWKPGEMIRRHTRRIESEKVRLQKKQSYLVEQEKKAMKELKKFLGTSLGNLQLQYLMKLHNVSGYNSNSSSNSNSRTGHQREQQQVQQQVAAVVADNRDNNNNAAADGEVAAAGGSESVQANNSNNVSASASTAITVGAMTAMTAMASRITSMGAAAGSGRSARNTLRNNNQPTSSSTALSAYSPNNLLSSLFQHLPFSSSSSSSAAIRYRRFDETARILRKRCALVTKSLESMQYDMKYPPLFACYHPSCLCNNSNNNSVGSGGSSVTFTEIEQYFQHVYLLHGGNKGSRSSSSRIRVRDGDDEGDNDEEEAEEDEEGEIIEEKEDDELKGNKSNRSSSRKKRESEKRKKEQEKLKMIKQKNKQRKVKKSQKQKFDDMVTMLVPIPTALLQNTTMAAPNAAPNVANAATVRTAIATSAAATTSADDAAIVLSSSPPPPSATVTTTLPSSSSAPPMAPLISLIYLMLKHHHPIGHDTLKTFFLDHFGYSEAYHLLDAYMMLQELITKTSPTTASYYTKAMSWYETYVAEGAPRQCFFYSLTSSPAASFAASAASAASAVQAGFDDAAASSAGQQQQQQPMNEDDGNAPALAGPASSPAPTAVDSSSTAVMQLHREDSQRIIQEQLLPMFEKLKEYYFSIHPATTIHNTATGTAEHPSTINTAVSNGGGAVKKAAGRLTMIGTNKGLTVADQTAAAAGSATITYPYPGMMQAIPEYLYHESRRISPYASTSHDLLWQCFGIDTATSGHDHGSQQAHHGSGQHGGQPSQQQPLPQYWTEEYILLPQSLYHFLYEALSRITYHYACHRQQLESSAVYQQGYLGYLTEIATRQEISYQEDFKKYRWQIIQAWSRSYYHLDRHMSQVADTAVEMVLERELEYWCTQRVMKQEVKYHVMGIHYQEQVAHEKMMLIADESILWAEENVLDTIFNFYAQSLLKAMWEEEDFRKGMLQYAGILKVTVNTRSGGAGGGGGTGGGGGVSTLQQQQKEQQAKVWLEQLVKQTSTIEKKKFIPLNHDQAATRIQAKYRSHLARKKVRKIFAKAYKKFYDESTNRPYYFNVSMGSTSWERPRMFRLLYKTGDW